MYIVLLIERVNLAKVYLGEANLHVFLFAFDLGELVNGYVYDFVATLRVVEVQHQRLQFMLRICGVSLQFESDRFGIVEFRTSLTCEQKEKKQMLTDTRP